MTDPVQAMFEAGIVEATDFDADSRYHGTALRHVRAPDGRLLPCLARRFVPPPEAFATLSWHRVAAGERLDQIAARAIGSAETFWQICDANRAIWPQDLETAGTELRLTLPEGIPGPQEAP